MSLKMNPNGPVLAGQLTRYASILVEGGQAPTAGEFQLMVDHGGLAAIRDSTLERVDLEELRRFLGLCPTRPELFPVWQTEKVGAGYPSCADFVEQMYKDGLDYDRSTVTSIQRTHITEVSQTLELVRVTPRQAGFKRSAGRGRIADKFAKYGLHQCPAEVALWLITRVRSLGLRDEAVTVSSRPVPGNRGEPNVFQITASRDGSKFGLGVVHGAYTSAVDPDESLVFTRTAPPDGPPLGPDREFGTLTRRTLVRV